MRIDIEVNNRKSPFDGSLQMAWKGTGISPFPEELIIEVDPFFDLGKAGPPSHLSENFPLIDFEGFTLFKIGAVLDGPDSKSEVGKLLTIAIGDLEGDFSLHQECPFKRLKSASLFFKSLIFFAPFFEIREEVRKQEEKGKT